MSWLKKSPAHPSYNSSQKKPSQADGQVADGDEMHKFMFFYPSDLLIVPEFRYENKTDELKRKDMALMV